MEPWLLLLLPSGVIVVYIHWRITRKDLIEGLKPLSQLFVPHRKVPKSPDIQARIEDEMAEVRMQMVHALARVIVHICLAAFLAGIVELWREPSILALSWEIIALFTWLMYSAILTGQVLMTTTFVRTLFLILNVCVLVGILMCSWASNEEYLGRFGMTLGSQILLGVVFPSDWSARTSLCYAAAFIVSFTQVHGSQAINAWFFIQQTFQLGISNAIPHFIDTIIRRQIAASCESKDSDSLIVGFRRMLRGICDGDLLLDGDLKICGSCSCLQRLLASKEDFSGRCFLDLIQEDMRVSFQTFLNSEDASNACSSPASCLRVPLVSTDRTVSVDVFHVSVPRLYGCKSIHHLVSLTEDVDSRLPEAAPGSLPTELLAARCSARPCCPPAPSMTSDATQAEFYDELAEMTLLLNTSTELLDIEEAHLCFVRQTDKPEFRMGMPTLKRFARPLDWTQIEAVLRDYGQLVATDQAKPQQALPPVMIRVPGESRRHVRARSATVSSPFDRSGSDDPVYLYLHMENFQDPGQRPPPRLEGLDEDALSSLPIPPPLVTPRALAEEDKEQMTPASPPKRRARQRRSRGPRQ